MLGVASPAMVCRYFSSEHCNLLVFKYSRNFTSKHSFSLCYFNFFNFLVTHDPTNFSQDNLS